MFYCQLEQENALNICTVSVCVVLVSAIERSLESEEQERVSADMRIRKSQVNDVNLKLPSNSPIFEGFCLYVNAALKYFLFVYQC